MQNILEETRKKLSPFIGETKMPMTIQNANMFFDHEPTSRFVRKIPRKNYEDLPKLIPIKWL